MQLQQTVSRWTPHKPSTTKHGNRRRHIHRKELTPPSSADKVTPDPTTILIDNAGYDLEDVTQHTFNESLRKDDPTREKLKLK